jgi:hypothetical protein
VDSTTFTGPISTFFLRALRALFLRVHLKKQHATSFWPSTVLTYTTQFKRPLIGNQSSDIKHSSLWLNCWRLTLDPRLSAHLRYRCAPTGWLSTRIACVSKCISCAKIGGGNFAQLIRFPSETAPGRGILRN